MKKNINEKIRLSVIVSYLVGILLGVLFLFFISKSDKSLINKEITEYISFIKNGTNNSFINLLLSFKNNILYLLLIWICSISIILSPISYLIIFYKGFLNGFFISAFVMIFGLKGILYSTLFYFPHEIINIIIMLIFTIIMLSITYKLITYIKYNKTINIKLFSQKIGLILIFTITITLISSILEIYINKYIIRLILK